MVALVSCLHDMGTSVQVDSRHPVGSQACVDAGVCPHPRMSTRSVMRRQHLSP